MEKEIPLTKLPDYAPDPAKYFWINPSEVIPEVLKEIGPLEEDEIQIAKKVATQKEYRYSIKSEVALENEGDYITYPYVKVCDLKVYLKRVLQELDKTDDKENVYITLSTEGDYDSGTSYYLNFNLPGANPDYINKKAIKKVIEEIKSLRKTKEWNRKREEERKAEEKIAQEKEEELSRLITWLQIGKITAEEFRKRSDAIYNKG